MSRVLVITNNPRQASFRLRIEALIQPLSQRGLDLQVQVRPRGLRLRRALLRSAGAYDAVILQRKLLGHSDARLLRKSARRIFFDVDDAVMYDQPDAGRFARWRAWRRFVATAANVDHVVAGNAHLADLFGRRGVQTSILPTVLDVHRYPVKTHAATHNPTLLWIGSHSTLDYLRQIAPQLARAAELVPALRLLVIADRPLDSVPLPMEFVPWSIEAEAAALIRGDVGIAPTPLDRWTQGKCGFKIVQYMAAGLPAIASPVGANAELVVAGQTGLLPQEAQDWPAAIAMLAQDAGLRARMGAAARARCEREYSLGRAVEFWDTILNGS